MTINTAMKNSKMMSIFNMDHKTDSYTMIIVKHIVSVTILGAVSLSVVYPLSLSEKIVIDGYGEGNSGYLDFYRKIVQEDGITGLYRGYAVSCMGIAIYRGVYFALYDAFKPLLGPDADAKHQFALGFGMYLIFIQTKNMS